jgi:hypothetical protein
VQERIFGDARQRISYFAIENRRFRNGGLEKSILAHFPHQKIIKHLFSGESGVQRRITL